MPQMTSRWSWACGGPDVEGIRAMFPYGRMLPVEVRGGGLSFQSGRVVEALGDGADRAVIAVAAVTVGF